MNKIDPMTQLTTDIVPEAADKAAKLSRALLPTELEVIVKDYLESYFEGEEVPGQYPTKKMADQLYPQIFDMVGKSSVLMPILVDGGTRWELATREKNSEDMVILCWLPGNKETPFVTWMARIDTPNGTYWGHYHKNLTSAFHDFEDR